MIIRLNQGDYGLISGLIWIISVFLLYKTVKPPRLSINKKKDKISSSFYFLLLFVFLLKIIFISFYPTNVFFHGDEAINSRNAQSNFESGLNLGKWNILSSGSGTLNEMPALWYFLQGAIIHILGPSLLSVKIFTIISDLILCRFIYLIIRQLFNKQLAFFASIIYISLPIAIHFSMTGYQNLQSTVMLYWSIYLLSLIPTKFNYRDLIYYCLASGIVCGISMYFYLSSTINPIICLLIIFSIIIFEYQFSFLLKLKYIFVNFGYFLVGFVVTTIPYLYYSIYKYDFINGRSSEFIFTQLKSDLIKTITTQQKNFFQGFLPSGIFNGSGQHYINASLLPGIVLFILFIIGLLVSLKKIKQRTYFISLIILLITSITGGILTKEPPTAQRLLHLFPLVIFFIIFAINLIKIQWIQIIIVVYLSIVNLNYYIFQNIPYYQKRLDKDVYEITKIIKKNPQKLFFNAPFHKKDQIYYYSQGKINPEPISQKDFVNIHPGYYFLDNLNLPLLNSSNPPKYEMMREWFTTYDHTILLKFN